MRRGKEKNCGNPKLKTKIVLFLSFYCIFALENNNKTFKDMKSDRLNSEVVLSWEEFSQLRAAMRENLSKNALEEVEIFDKINNFNL